MRSRGGCHLPTPARSCRIGCLSKHSPLPTGSVVSGTTCRHAHLSHGARLLGQIIGLEVSLRTIYSHIHISTFIAHTHSCSFPSGTGESGQVCSCILAFLSCPLDRPTGHDWSAASLQVMAARVTFDTPCARSLVWSAVRASPFPSRTC